jgi:hypothetical protein
VKIISQINIFLSKQGNQMKKLLLLNLILATSTAVSADSINIKGSGGSISINDNGISIGSTNRGRQEVYIDIEDDDQDDEYIRHNHRNTTRGVYKNSDSVVIDNGVVILRDNGDWDNDGDMFIE